jgi:tetratricopeptide (TPR) repeat protein/CHAT domain-containing protein
MRYALPRSLWLCLLPLGVCLAGAPTPLRAGEDARPVVIDGKLARDDPRDAVRKESGHKVHEVKLEAGKCYQIDLASKDFDTFLRLEDAKRNQLAYNDDFDPDGNSLDSRLYFVPPASAAYRLIVTSFNARATGAYRLRVQPLQLVEKEVVEEDRLDTTDPSPRGHHIKVRGLDLTVGEVYVIDLASKDFDAMLLLQNDRKKLVAMNDDAHPGTRDARLCYGPPRSGKCILTIMSAVPGQVGQYRLRVRILHRPGSASRSADLIALEFLGERGKRLFRAGSYVEATRQFERGLALSEKLRGAEERETAAWLNNLALAYAQLGRHAEAEPLYRRSLAITESALGKDHFQVSAVLNNLATLAASQGRYAEAEALEKRSLAIREKQLGPDHPEVARTLTNLGKLYRDQGRYAEAEALYRRGLAIREKRLGKDHPDVASSLAHLGGLHAARWELAQAEALYRRSLAVKETRLGKDHPDVAATLTSLGGVAHKQERHAEAEALYRRALAIRESKLGKDHPDVAATLHNLALLYHTQGRYADAEAHFQRALAIEEDRLGKDHPELAVTLGNLALLRQVQGQYDEAERLLKRSLAIKESRLGKDHPRVAIDLTNLAQLYQELGRHARAEALFLRSLAILKAKLGEGHREVAACQNNLAMLYRAEGRHAEAERLHLAALASTERTQGKDSLAAAVSFNNLAGVYQDQAGFAEAEALFLRSLAIEERTLGKDHPRVAVAANNLALLYEEQGRLAEAEPLFRRSLAIKETRLGKDHPDVPVTLGNLGNLYLRLRKEVEAEALFRRCLAISEGKLGKDHPRVATELNNLADVCRRLGRHDEAERLFRRALAIKEKRLGGDHAGVALVLNNLALLYAEQARWAEAFDTWDASRRVLRRHEGAVLAGLPEADQLAFLHTHAVSDFPAALTLGWRRRQDAAARAKAASWLVNGKAMAQQTLAEQVLLERDSKGRPWAALVEELAEVRRRLAALAVRVPSAEQLAAHRRQLDELADREKGLARRIAQEGHRGEQRRAWVEVADLQRALPGDAVLVEVVRLVVYDFQARGKAPYWQPPRYVAFVIDARGVELVDLGPAAAIERAVQEVRSDLQRAPAVVKEEGEPDAEKVLKARLARLSAQVLTPLLPHLKTYKRWVICPDGALWLVPWSALLLPDGRYAVEGHTVSHLISARDLVAAAAAAKAGAPAVLADPDFDLRAARPSVPDGDGLAARRRSALGEVRFGRLPGTAAEAKLIAPKLKTYAGETPKVYTGAEATEAAFKALKGPRVLVLSTHGFFLPDVERPPEDDLLLRPSKKARPEDNPLLRSGLALAGANEREAASKQGVDDGILTALEILGTDLRGTELVVLSACETGLGEVRIGEGVAGLRQAFQLAGAQSVVASLWQVPDRQTAQLMGRLFDHLAAGRGRADALRLAQLEMIRARRQREGAAHPFFWAAFTLTGQTR